MDKESVMQQVVQAVVQVQEASGRATAGIGAGTRPIGDAAGFDSLNGMQEYASELSGEALHPG